MNNILEEGKSRRGRAINFLICISIFVLVAIFLTGCGDVANTNGETNQSVSSPTVTAIATKVRQSGKNMQAVLGSSLGAFIQYFHRNPDGQDDRSPGKRYEWIVPDVGSDSNMSFYDVTINKDGVVVDVDIVFSQLVKF